MGMQATRPHHCPLREEREHGQLVLVRGRKNGYLLPPLDVARAEFEKRLGATIDWGPGTLTGGAAGDVGAQAEFGPVTDEILPSGATEFTPITDDMLPDAA